jgi:hypothetical protein
LLAEVEVVQLHLVLQDQADLVPEDLENLVELLLDLIQ